MCSKPATYCLCKLLSLSSLNELFTCGLSFIKMIKPYSNKTNGVTPHSFIFPGSETTPASFPCDVLNCIPIQKIFLGISRSLIKKQQPHGRPAEVSSEGFTSQQHSHLNTCWRYSEQGRALTKNRWWKGCIGKGEKGSLSLSLVTLAETLN